MDSADLDLRLDALAGSFRRLTGRDLVAPGPDLSARLWSAPRAVVAHGLEADPLFFYGNRLALELFELDVETFTRMPSRLSAEPVEQAERERLLGRVATAGFIDDYEGVRISARGKRFRIEAAVVWNITDPEGAPLGQAATFDRWTFLD